MHDLTNPTASPFDAIRQERDGGEFWSARDLAPLLGYEQWRRFEDAIERAKTSASAQSEDAGHHFAGAGKVMETGRWGNQTVADVHLTRYACYLVAMNGDPRKAEVAAAQSYFAVKTREAEVAQPRELTEDEIVHQALQITAKKVEALRIQVAELEPKAELADKYLNAKPNGRLVREVAKTFEIAEGNLRTFLREQGLIFTRQALCGATIYDFKAEFRPHFEAREKVVTHSWGDCQHYTLYVTPRGVELIRKRLKAHQDALVGAGR